MRENC